MSNKELSTPGNFLEFCVPWTGFEKDLPVGVIGIPNTINILQLVKNVIIFDDDTEDGLRTIKVKDVQEGMSIVNCELWNSRIEAMNINSIKIKDPNGGKELNMWEWYNSISADGKNPRHTNGLAMWALNKLRSKSSGPGVKF